MGQALRAARGARLLALLYVEFVPRQTALTVMHGLERAFAAFGGVPRECSSIR